MKGANLIESLQEMLEREAQTIPRQFIVKMIDRKLRAAGVEPSKELTASLTDHVFSGGGEPFVAPGGLNDPNVKLTLDEADVDEVMQEISHFLEDGLPKIIRDVAKPISKTIFTDLASRWAEEEAMQDAELSGFRERLYGDWGKPLGQLRMLLTIAREWCQEALHRDKAFQKPTGMRAQEALLRLQVRGCQVADEIICLLENGFADGAMARWRTLHEIAVVAAVIAKHGDDIAERYLAHQAVESFRSMEKYQKCSEELGYKPISQKKIEKITKAYETALATFGKSFKTDYGWAAHHLQSQRPTFTDLEKEAGREEMLAHNQMANDNIHAGIKSLYFRLGLQNPNTLLAGRSNIGFIEPGQNTAHTLTQLTVLACLSEPKLDDLVFGHVIQMLRDEIPRSFVKADKRLQLAEKKLRASEQKRKKR